MIKNKFIVVGGTILSFFFIIAILAPIIAPYDPWETGEPLLPPSPEHILGTNDMGQDIFSELIYGARVSIFIGFFAALVSIIIGTIIGVISGYFRGKLDEILMSITDILLVIPALPLMIILTAYLGANIWNIIIVIGILWWAPIARVVRSRTLQIREMEFIQICKATGANDYYIIFVHVIPNCINVVLAQFILSIARAMLAEAGLSFLGLGDPIQKSWGTMLHYAFSRGGFANNMWWWYVPPGICIALCVLGFVLLGIGLEQHYRKTWDFHD